MGTTATLPRRYAPRHRSGGNGMSPAAQNADKERRRTFADLLRAEIEPYKVSQAQLAEASNISAASISDYFRAMKIPMPEYIDRLAGGIATIAGRENDLQYMAGVRRRLLQGAGYTHATDHDSSLPKTIRELPEFIMLMADMPQLGERSATKAAAILRHLRQTLHHDIDIS